MVNELRVNWKASLLSAFGFERPADANQFEGVPCPVRWKQQFVFLCFPSRLCEKQCCPVSARDIVFPPLREAVLVLASAKGIVVTLYLAFSLHARFFLFYLSLGRCTHPTCCHIASAQGPCPCCCCMIPRIKTACFIVIDITDIQRASRVSSRRSTHLQW